MIDFFDTVKSCRTFNTQRSKTDHVSSHQPQADPGLLAADILMHSMGKLLKAALLILTSLAAIAATGLYLLRNPLLEAVIGDQLNRQGFPLQSIAAVDLSINSLHLQDLIAGKNNELRLQKLSLAWNLPDLFAGKPVSAEIIGLNMTIDARTADLNASMQPRAPAAQSAIRIPWLPIVTLQDSAIHLHSAAGDVSLALSGRIGAQQSGTQTIHLSGAMTGSFIQAKAALQATLDEQGNIQGKATVSDGTLDLPAIKIANFSNETNFTFAALQPQQLKTTLAINDARLSNNAEKSTAEIALDQMILTGSALKSPEAWTGQADLTVSGGQLSAGPVKIEQLSASIPVQAKFDSANWQAGLRNPGQISLKNIVTGYPVQIRGLRGFSIDQADFEIISDAQGTIINHHIAITPGKLTLLAQQDSSAGCEVNIQPGKIVLNGRLNTNDKYQGKLTLQDAALSLPQSQLQAAGISAALYLNDEASDDTTGNFAIARLQHLAAEPLFAALSFSGDIRNIGGKGNPAEYALNISGGTPNLQFLKITGRHRSADGNGRLTAKIVPLKFSPANLQPSALSPSLQQLEDVSGHVSAHARLQWSADGIRNSGGAFAIRDLSFTRETTKVSNLNVRLNLDSLVTPSSPPHQLIAIQRIDAGIPLENLSIAYQIEDTTPPRIALEQAQFSVIDGTVTLVPTIIDPAVPHTDMLFQIGNIDLETLFSSLKIDGLTGSGHLDGKIPLRIEDKHVTIHGGHLATKTPGVLRFKSEKASKMLSSAGKEMNLLLQAMQDFHYTELSLSLDKSASNELIAQLSLLGNNPEVKDGRAFRLNIKLETDIDKILQTINQGYHLSHEILRGSFILR